MSLYDIVGVNFNSFSSEITRKISTRSTSVRNGESGRERGKLMRMRRKEEVWTLKWPP